MRVHYCIALNRDAAGVPFSLYPTEIPLYYGLLTEIADCVIMVKLSDK